MNIQLDFGGFDPAFLGVSVRFANERLFEFYKAYTHSPTPLPVAHLAEDERFEALSIASVLAHEIRHFHDFFLTPYSARVFSKRIQMLICLLQAVPAVVADGPNCVPVPFVTWCGLDAAGREAQLAWLPARSDGRPWRPVELPWLGGDPARDDDMARLLRRVFQLREDIRELTYNPQGVGVKSSLQPWQVFELPAVLVQMSELWSTYGQAETTFYFDYLARSGANPYSTMLRLTRKLWDDEGQMMDSNVASAMASWSLLGSYAQDQWKACPTERYARLWAHLRQAGVPSWDGGPEALFEDWSSTLGLSTVHEGLLDARDSFRSIRSLIDGKAEQLSKGMLGAGHTAFLQRVTASVSAASDHMVATFEDEPAAYVAPYHYQQSADRWVNPLLRHVYAGGGVVPEMSPAQMQERGYLIQWAQSDEGRLLIQSMVEPYPLSPHRFLDAEDAVELATLIGLGDYLVSDTDRVRSDVQQPGRTFFDGTHLRPFELFV